MQKINSGWMAFIRHLVIHCSLLCLLLSACASLSKGNQPPDFNNYRDLPLPVSTKAWLKEGNQSGISPSIAAAAATITGQNRRELLYKVVDYVWTHFKYDSWENQRMFSRTANELFQTLASGGCSDFALIIATLFRAVGIPARLVITANIDWIQRYQDNQLYLPTGHVFVEAYLEDRWYLVDFTYRLLFSEYQEQNKSFPRNEYFCRRGIDYWQLGLRNVEDILFLFDEQSRHFSIDLYHNPSYASQPL